MTVTSKSFKGGDEELRQRFQPDDQFGPSEAPAALLKGAVGANAMNSREAKGLAGPTNAMTTGPRRAGASQPVSAGNDASTGAQGVPPGQHPVTKGTNPTSTGAGQGGKTIKTYGPGGGETGVGGVGR